jgi:hypothetical protein
MSRGSVNFASTAGLCISAFFWRLLEQQHVLYIHSPGKATQQQHMPPPSTIQQIIKNANKASSPAVI